MAMTITSPVLPDLFATGTLMIDGQTVQLPQLLTVRQLVSQRPRRARVFEKYGLPYCCCSGNKTFLDACDEKGIDPNLVLADLRESDAQQKLPREEQADASTYDPTEMRRQIVEIHHTFLRSELMRLSFLIDRVANRHGALYNELWELQGVFEEFKAEVEQHLDNQEDHLIPLLKRLESTGQNSAALQTALAKEIRSLEAKQAYFCQALSQMNSLTSVFHSSETLCNTLRVMLHSLSELAEKMNVFIKDENNLLLAWSTYVKY